MSLKKFILPIPLVVVYHIHIISNTGIYGVYIKYIGTDMEHFYVQPYVHIIIMCATLLNKSFPKEIQALWPNFGNFVRIHSKLEVGLYCQEGLVDIPWGKREWNGSFAKLCVTRRSFRI